VFDVWESSKNRNDRFIFEWFRRENKVTVRSVDSVETDVVVVVAKNQSKSIVITSKDR
jgi:hypothetical protein